MTLRENPRFFTICEKKEKRDFKRISRRGGLFDFPVLQSKPGYREHVKLLVALKIKARKGGVFTRR